MTWKPSIPPKTHQERPIDMASEEATAAYQTMSFKNKVEGSFVRSDCVCATLSEQDHRVGFAIRVSIVLQTSPKLSSIVCDAPLVRPRIQEPQAEGTQVPQRP